MYKAHTGKNPIPALYISNKWGECSLQLWHMRLKVHVPTPSCLDIVGGHQWPCKVLWAQSGHCRWSAYSRTCDWHSMCLVKKIVCIKAAFFFEIISYFDDFHIVDWGDEGHRAPGTRVRLLFPHSLPCPAPDNCAMQHEWTGRDRTLLPLAETVHWPQSCTRKKRFDTNLVPQIRGHYSKYGLIFIVVSHELVWGNLNFIVYVLPC